MHLWLKGEGTSVDEKNVCTSVRISGRVVTAGQARKRERYALCLTCKTLASVEKDGKRHGESPDITRK